MERAKGDIDDAKQRFTMAAKRYERDGQKPADRQKYLRNCQKQAVTKQGRIGRELIKLEKELSELSEDDAEAAKEAEIAELMQESQVLEEEEENIKSQIEDQTQQLSQYEDETNDAAQAVEQFAESIETGDMDAFMYAVHDSAFRTEAERTGVACSPPWPLNSSARV